MKRTLLRHDNEMRMRNPISMDQKPDSVKPEGCAHPPPDMLSENNNLLGDGIRDIGKISQKMQFMLPL